MFFLAYGIRGKVKYKYQTGVEGKCFLNVKHEKERLANLRKNTAGSDSSALPGNKSWKKTAALIIAAVSVCLLVFLSYLTFFPLPLYEDVELDNLDSEVWEEINSEILGKKGVISEKHKELIEKTKELYSQRKSELMAQITAENSPVTLAAVENAKSQMPNTGIDGLEFAGFSWKTPDADVSISDEEADMLLYLYSTMFDYDWFYTEEDRYEKWLCGFGDTNATYSVTAFGQTFSFPCSSGYYMSQEQVNEMRSLAHEAYKTAYRQARIKQIFRGAGQMVAAWLPFVDIAYAEDGTSQSPAQQATQSAIQASEAYATRIGTSSAIDTIIYTGVSDQVSGMITFSTSPVPEKTWSGSIEDYAMGRGGSSEIKGLVTRYKANPFLGRVTIEGQTPVTRNYQEGEHWNGDYHLEQTGPFLRPQGSDKDGNTQYGWEYDWENVKTMVPTNWLRSETVITVRVYPVKETAYWTGELVMNASSLYNME